VALCGARYVQAVLMWVLCKWEGCKVCVRSMRVWVGSPSFASYAFVEKSLGMSLAKGAMRERVQGVEIVVPAHRTLEGCGVQEWTCTCVYSWVAYVL